MVATEVMAKRWSITVGVVLTFCHLVVVKGFLSACLMIMGKLLCLILIIWMDELCNFCV